jgi:hypothetical protein
MCKTVGYYHCVQVAKQRRNWRPFGAAAKETPQDSVTVQVGQQATDCNEPAGREEVAVHGSKAIVAGRML